MASDPCAEDALCTMKLGGASALCFGWLELASSGSMAAVSYGDRRDALA